jgi:hypothetical protein
MTDLRKAAEEALLGFKKIRGGCKEIRKDPMFHIDARKLAWYVQKDCKKYIELLNQTLEEKK